MVDKTKYSEQENEDVLINHLYTSGYRVAKIHQVNTKGATKCRYFKVCCSDKKQLFVKIGERVDREIKNIQTFKKIDVKPKLLHGSSVKQRIL